MSLESASYISQLNSANPPAGDPVANAADHLRLIKAVLQTTFPSLGTTPLTATPQRLNNSLVPTGAIIMWSQNASGAIPTGWGLCDGTVYSKQDGSGPIGSPDLRDRFIVGAGLSYTHDTGGGSPTHIHNVWTGGTGLTQAQIPNLAIVVSDPGHSHAVNDPGHNHVTNSAGTYGAAGGGGSVNLASAGGRDAASLTGVYLSASATGITAYTSATGGGTGQVHTHAAAMDVQSNIPPYIALAFIMKL